MSDTTIICIRDEETAEMFQRQRHKRGMSSDEYLRHLMEEVSVSRSREELIEQTERLNERLAELIDEGDVI